MSLKEHPAYKEEVERLGYTKEQVDEFITVLEGNNDKYKEQIREAFENLDYLDSSQSYISILTNAKFMELDNRHLEGLQTVRNKPYFCRIDFREEHGHRPEKLYIGKVALLDPETKKLLIVDWRAPVANVYYEGRLGDVTYDTPRGKVQGELKLKRQYTINDGRLENIHDIDITTNDTFLQASVGAHADNRLKDIASTIQAEQNRVIRADIDKPLIVQGVAGSGKTTIALHRIAYLIYTYEENFIPENFMIMAPNRLFINYISEVLPELGVERVKQTTFVDFLVEVLKIKHKLTNANEKMMVFLNGTTDKEHQSLVQWAAGLKSSLAFKEVIDGYIREVEESFVPVEDFAVEGYVILSYEEIKRLFLTEYSYLPLNRRIEEIKKHLSFKLKGAKKNVLEEIQENCDKELEQLRAQIPDLEERRAKIFELTDARDSKLAAIKKGSGSLVSKYMAKFPKQDLMHYYQDIVTRPEVFYSFSPLQLGEARVKYLCETAATLLAKKQIELEDGAALLYLKHKLFGFEADLDVKNVVIDEAQDFSVFQFYAMREVLGTEMFTIFGDLSQGIHAYRGIQDWEAAGQAVFPDGFNYKTLEQSYRTTVEIMDLANEIIKKSTTPGLVLAKPVIRHGEKPELKQFATADEIVQAVKKKIPQLQKEGFKSIALIGKTVEECKRLKKLLDKDGAIKAAILSGEETTYQTGVIIVPSYVAKGLEFDVVFIINLEDRYTTEDMDIKLLYVAMTRSLHRLYVYHTEGTMPLLTK